MDKSKIAAAINMLITEKGYAKRVGEIRELIGTWETTPRVFAGALSVLNVLVDIGLESPDDLDKLLAIAEDRRKLIPLQKKVDYQRVLMQERRRRLKKAVELEELVRGRRMSADERKAYEKKTQAQFIAQRAAFIAAKGDISWSEKNDASQEFWAKIDAQLDVDLDEARKVLDRAPIKRKRVVTVEKPLPKTALSVAFTNAKKPKDKRR